MATGTTRGGVAVSNNFLTDIFNAAGLGGAAGTTPSNNSLHYSHGNAQTLAAQQSQQIGGHMDIHIAILSPPSSRFRFIDFTVLLFTRFTFYSLLLFL